MLSIARALMARPQLLLLDEPSLGLAPLIVKQIFDVIRELNEQQGLTVFLVEQNAFHALKLAHRGYVMVNGNITMQGTGKELLANPKCAPPISKAGSALDARYSLRGTLDLAVPVRHRPARRRGGLDDRPGLAMTWRLLLLALLLLLGIGVRFIHHALFEGTMLSLHLLCRRHDRAADLRLLGFRYYRANQMVTQYHWLYERLGPFPGGDESVCRPLRIRPRNCSVTIRVKTAHDVRGKAAVSRRRPHGSGS